MYESGKLAPMDNNKDNCRQQGYGQRSNDEYKGQNTDAL